MSKDSIEVWNIQFYKIDRKGRMLLNADGKLKGMKKAISGGQG